MNVEGLEDIIEEEEELKKKNVELKLKLVSLKLLLQQKNNKIKKFKGLYYNNIELNKKQFRFNLFYILYFSTLLISYSLYYILNK